MKVTESWIMANRTRNGGWTRKQLAAIGIEWPPVKGWKLGVIGIEIPDENQIQFESEAGRTMHRIST